MIWCDLDNTLIWTWDPLITSPLLSVAFNLPIENKPPSGKGRRRLTKIEVPNLGSGYACARPSANAFLRELRRIDRVMLLTNALRSYAAAMNTAFAFGFSDVEMVTREDLLGSANVDPKAVLIDNEPMFGPDTEHDRARARKMRYLGSGLEAIVEVPYYRGVVTDDFERNWRTYVSKVDALHRR